VKIDLGTFALILIISNIIQAMFIFVHAAISKKYKGLKEYAIGSIALAAGFLFISTQSIVSPLTVINIFGNSLIILAAMFQYAGLMRFIGSKVNYRLIFALFFISVMLFSYFTIRSNVTVRVVDAACIISILFMLTARGFFNKDIRSSVFKARALGIVYLFVALLSLIRAVIAVFPESENSLLTPVTMQILSYATVFIVTLFTTFEIIYIINLRLKTEISESKICFEQIFNLNPDAALITSFSDGKIMNFNREFLAYFGYTYDELIGKCLFDLNIYEDINCRQDILKILNEKELLKSKENKFICKDGSRKVFIVSLEKIVLNNMPYLISIAHDITENNENKEDNKNSEEKYRFLTEFASDVTWVYNLSKNKYSYVSPSVFELRGLTSEEAESETLEDSFTAESLPFLMDAIANNSEKFISNPDINDCFVSELQQPCKNGDKLWTEVSTKYNYNEDGEIEIIGVSRNIERRKKFEKQVQYLSYHDQLTGLYNRRFYDEELKRLDIRRNLPIALIMLDVNGLKLVNDAFGHVAGDILLEKVSNVFKAECRSDEIVSRIGGDEFVVLLIKSNKEDAKKFVDRIKTAISKEKVYDVNLSVSIGMAIKQNMNEDILKVYNKAEDDMYRNKLAERSIIRKKTIAIIMNSLYKQNYVEKLHSKRVEGLCECLANELHWDKEAVNEIKTAGLMHDIGKIGISDIIVSKTEKLSETEFNEIKRHVENGYRILSSSSEFSNIAEFIYEHHERWDGSGYPRGLKGEEISIQGRIIAIADSFDVMKSERAYCREISETEAISELKKGAGTQFDPDLARLFVEKVLEKTWE